MRHLHTLVIQKPGQGVLVKGGWTSWASRRHFGFCTVGSVWICTLLSQTVIMWCLKGQRRSWKCKGGLSFLGRDFQNAFVGAWKASSWEQSLWFDLESVLHPSLKSWVLWQLIKNIHMLESQLCADQCTHVGFWAWTHYKIAILTFMCICIISII